MELGLASHAVLAVEDSRSVVSPGALLVIDLPGCFSPQMVPTWPYRFNRQVKTPFTVQMCFSTWVLSPRLV